VKKAETMVVVRAALKAAKSAASMAESWADLSGALVYLLVALLAFRSAGPMVAMWGSEVLVQRLDEVWV